MHSYPHNIKTFNSATRHLTRVERALYRDMIELYYDTELPLTSDMDRLCRLVIATTEEEKAALIYVLSEFFELTGTVYTHDYCDEQIAKYKQSLTAKSAAGIASANAKKQRADERKAERATQHQQNSTGVEQVCNEIQLTNNQEPITSIKTLVPPAGGTGVAKIPIIDHKSVVDLYNRILPELPEARLITDRRRSAINGCAMIKPVCRTLEFWEQYFNDVRESDFLMGRKTDFKADLDFLTTKNKFVRVVEGSYA
jgi:uncharacterized protein YdaU (DUF1376 family)